MVNFLGHVSLRRGSWHPALERAALVRLPGAKAWDFGRSWFNRMLPPPAGEWLTIKEYASVLSLWSRCDGLTIKKTTHEHIE